VGKKPTPQIQQSSNSSVAAILKIKVVDDPGLQQATGRICLGVQGTQSNWLKEAPALLWGLLLSLYLVLGRQAREGHGC
jgi:hypothetical protein